MLVVWALFDDGNMSVYKALKDNPNYKVISVGIQKKDDVFYCDLTDIDVIKKLKLLPKPDIIVASPMCESWSMGSNMRGGNACWRDSRISNLFETNEYLGIRKKSDYEYDGCQFKFIKSLHKRVIGELCVVHLLEIIDYFQPKFWYIENPQFSRMWFYIDEICCWMNRHVKNITHYNAYDNEIEKYSHKPTCFLSNIYLNLKRTNKQADIVFNKVKTKETQKCVFDYDERSKIPQELIIDIFSQFYAKINEQIQK